MNNPESDALHDYLRLWRERAKQYQKSSVLLNGQQLLDKPYIMTTMCHDRRAHLLIATVENRDWYDNLNFTEGYRVQRLGMLSRGDTVFDCGSNAGVTSIVYANMVGPEGAVFGFDPFPLNVAIARFNVGMNGFDNVRFQQVAISDNEEPIIVSQESQRLRANFDARDAVWIDSMPLDRMLDVTPDYIKIDIEGSEVNALRGAQGILKSLPALYIELHPEYLRERGQSAMDIFPLLDMDRYLCFLDYPGRPGMMPYNSEFELTEPCAVFFVPKTRPPIERVYAD